MVKTDHRKLTNGEAALAVFNGGGDGIRRCSISGLLWQ
jgi:hypothetical protein